MAYRRRKKNLGGFVKENPQAILGGLSTLAGGALIATGVGAPLGASLIGSGVGMIGKEIQGDQQAKLMAQQQQQQALQQAALTNSIGTNNNNIPTFRRGGRIMYQNGGQLVEFEGNRHEQGGIPINDQVEVEGGETKFEDYVFSDTLMVPGTKNTFADESKKVKKRYGMRRNDKISEEATNTELAELAQLQEAIKREDFDNRVGQLQADFPEQFQSEIPQNEGLGELFPQFGIGVDLNQLEQPQNLKKGGIMIKPENRGKFTAFANRKGMGVQEAASHVLANKDKYSSTTVKRANFAKNFGGRRKKQFGGNINPTDPNITQIDEFAFANQPGDLDEEIANVYSEYIQPGAVELEPDVFTPTTNIAANTGLGQQGITRGTGVGGQILDYGLKNLGSIYEVGRGLKNLRNTVELDRLRPEQVQAEQLDPTRAFRQIDESFAGANAALRANAMSKGQLLTNRLASAAAEAGQKSNIAAEFANRNAQIRNQAAQLNAQLRGQAAQTNLGQANLEQDLTQRERDVASNMVQAGLTDLSDFNINRGNIRQKQDVQQFIIDSGLLATEEFDFINGEMVFKVFDDDGNQFWMGKQGKYDLSTKQPI